MKAETWSAAEIRQAGGLEAYIRRRAGQEDMGVILRIREVGRVGKKGGKQRNAEALRIPTEDEEQKAVLAWAEQNRGRCPALGLLFHIPNGGSRGKAEAGRFKAMGVKKGVPDLFLPAPRDGWHGLWVEMKRLKGGRVEPEQEDWHEKLRAAGYRVEVCRGAEAAIQVIAAYLGIKP